MQAESWAVVVAAVAIVVSIASAWYTSQLSRRATTADYQAAEHLKADLVTLVAALRSLIMKAAVASQDGQARNISTEIETIRRFQASSSGLALSTLAGQRGNRDEPNAGRWRTLGLTLADLGGTLLDDAPGTTASCGRLATSIEQTVALITQADLDQITRQLNDLHGVLTSLAHREDQDIVLRAWFDIYDKRAADHDPATLLTKLEAIESAGITDPDLRLMLSVLRDDADALKAALDDGASPDITDTELLRRYQAYLPAD